MKSLESSTLRDVALEAGVSIDTVSRVLNGKGKEKWPSAMRRAQEIRAIAERLNYRPNAAARAIRSSQTKVIGALVRNNPRDRHIHPVAYETLLGINEGLEAAGYVLSVIRFDDVQFDTEAGSRVFREHMVDGMIAMESIPQNVVERLGELMPNCVWANTNVWTDKGCIRRDEVAVGEMVATRLMDLGYRKLVIVGGTRASVPHYSHMDRFNGVMRVAKRHNIAVERVQMAWSPTFNPDQFPVQLIDRSVAFIAEGTYWAHWLTHLAEGMGKTPAYHFGLACCDESSEIRRYWPGLSRVTFDHYEMGMTAARMLLEQLGNAGKPASSVMFGGQWHAGNTAWGPGEASSA
jgi:LacI family transcriptional regulator